ncbi:50S ribosomal protein L16 [archaeon]|nr:50S ribosomal protein L16 [archaeon]|tara:strand:+ start:5110 stop:5649 length:540 start_codon:yes stop_codon:yes gene_type:complete
MAGLRKGSCYSKLERPYVRKSKKKSKSYIRTIPPNKIVRYVMGEVHKDFSYELNLVSKDEGQIRHNAIESARIVVNRRLNLNIGPKSYLFRVRIYPHHILRENKMLGGAHADRLQTGMAHAFGKPSGVAGQVKKGKTIFSAYTDKEHLDTAKKALWAAVSRIPVKCSITINEIKTNSKK